MDRLGRRIQQFRWEFRQLERLIKLRRIQQFRWRFELRWWAGGACSGTCAGTRPCSRAPDRHVDRIVWRLT